MVSLMIMDGIERIILWGDIILVKLKLNQNKVNEWNQRIDEFRKEYHEFSLSKISKLSDKFVPYSEVIIDAQYTKIQEDFRNINDFDGVYVCHLNANYDLEHMTDYKEEKTLTLLYIGIIMVWLIMLHKFWTIMILYTESIQNI